MKILLFTYSGLILFLNITACTSNRADRRCMNASRSSAYEMALSQQYLAIKQSCWSLATQVLPTGIPLLSTDGEEIFLDDLLSEKELLIFRYSYMHRQTSVKKILQTLNTFSEQDSTQQICIIATYAYFEHFVQFYDSGPFRFPFYLLPPFYATGPLEMSNPPYLFITDSSRHIVHPFIPFGQPEGGTLAYLSFLQTQGFSSVP